MTQKINKPLFLSLILLTVLILTLFYFYDYFVFHTYMNDNDDRLLYRGSYDDFEIQGFQIYQDQKGIYCGNARIKPTQDYLFLKDDQVKCTVTIIDKNQHSYTLKQQSSIQSTNEIVFFHSQKIDTSLLETTIEKIDFQMSIYRQNQKVYDQTISLKEQTYSHYYGGNKDYMIQDVCVSDRWLLSGTFHFYDPQLMKQYEYYTVDYLLLIDGDKDNFNDYERILHIVQKTNSFFNNEIRETYFDDGKDSLINKTLVCVISMYKNKDDLEPVTFSIQLHQ